MKTFESIKVNKPSLKGFEALKKCAYELTGLECYLNNEMYIEVSKCGKITFNLIYNFWFLRNEVKQLIKHGALPKYGFVDGNGEKDPFIYNRLIF